MAVEQLITQHIDTWTSALRTRSTAGRGTSGKIDLYGIKKLRELILELAVRGKLVPQDPNDEPASELLKRIAAEKAELVKQGKIKKQKPLPEISEDEKPFELPKEWEWVRLGKLSDAVTGNAFKTSEYADEGTFVLRVTNINPDGTINLADKKFIPHNLAETKYNGFSLKQGDILLVMVGGSLGKIGIVDNECLPALLNQNMWKMVKSDTLNHDFFIFGLKFINANQLNITHSTHGHLAQGDYLSKCFPLAPVDEQKQIAEKVSSLMTLCDQLEQQSLTSLDAHSQLVETLLSTLTDSQNAEELAENWARISQYFDTLFTTEASIDALKQTILQLAVMGKLVPQDPNEEPASELLKRIEQEKAQLVKEGKIKKQKPLPPVEFEEHPFSLPDSWEYVRLNNIASLIGGFAYKSSSFIKDSKYQVLRMGNIRPDQIRMDENPVFISDSVANDTSDYKLVSKDIVLTMTGTKGKRDYLYSAIIPDGLSRTLYLNQRICKVNVIMANAEFVNILMKSNSLLDVIYKQSTGTANQANISMQSLSAWVVPLPPLKEQNLIVKLSTELLLLCDQLKSRLQSAQQTQLHLADALTDAALN